MTSLWRAIHAFWRHDASEQLAHPLVVARRALTGLTVVFLLYFGADLVDPAAVGGVPYMLFATTGLTVGLLLVACVPALSQRVQRYQQTGLLEACIMTRTPITRVLFAVPAFDVFFALAHAFVGLLLAFWLVDGVAFPWASLGNVALFLALGALCFWAVGITAASLTLVLAGVDPMSRVATLACFLLGGVVVPRDRLPVLLHAIGDFLPVAPVLDGVRGALFEGLDLSGLMEPLLRTLVLVAVWVPIGVATARWALYRVLRDGRLTHF